MRQVSQHYRTGALTVGELPAPALRPGGLIVATRASLISAGTEKMLVELARANLAGKALSRPDLVRQVVNKARREGVLTTLEKVRSKLDTAIPLGYSCAGRVLEVGRDAGPYKPGDRVAGAGAGYANHAEYNYVPKNLCVPVPDGVADEDASFVTLGAIALQGVRQAGPTLGERIAVLGLGLLGLLTVQLLKANGCKVLGFDPVPDRCRLARELGADAACHADLDEAADAFSEGFGADAVIVTASTKSNEPVNAAARVARMKGRVVLVGMVGMNIQRDSYYRKELDLRLSMSYGPGRYDPEYEERGRDYPFAYVRWTERRNMQAFLELVREGRVTPRALITHRFDIREAERAYELLESREPYLGIVLTYPDEDASPPLRRITVTRDAVRPRPARGRVGFIGCGSFARSVLLPNLKRIGGIELTGVAATSGLSAQQAAAKFGFAYATTDPREILADSGTDTIFIVTRHDTHAPLACEALAAGKNVFVEKPLAIDREQLDRVITAAEAHSGQILMVGFNRRFAPLVCEAKRALEGRAAPLVMLYRINAGPIPRDSWVQGEEGGGRIIGEVCHFIDTLQFLADAPPVSVHTIQAEAHPDAVSVQLAFADGSIGTIVYSSLGDPSFPKEYIEVFGAGRVVTIDDFRSARFIVNGARSQRYRWHQDKGFRRELEAFLDACLNSGRSPITLDSLFATSMTTLVAGGFHPTDVGLKAVSLR